MSGAPVALTPHLQQLVVGAMPMVRIHAARRHRRARSVALDDLVAVGYQTLVELAPQYDPERGDFDSFASKRVRGAMLDYIEKLLPGAGAGSNLNALSLSSPLRELGLEESLAQSAESEHADLLDTISLPAFGFYASYVCGGSRGVEEEMVETLDMSRARRAIGKFNETLGEPELSMLQMYLRAEPVESIAQRVAQPVRTVERKLQNLRRHLRDAVLGRQPGATRAAAPGTAP